MNEDLSYTNHFGLIASPFQDVSDRRFIWLGERQLENLAHLRLGVEENKGIMLLLGDGGSGKSVLLECLMKIIAGRFTVAILREPQIAPKQFMEFLAAEYGIPGSITSKVDFLISLKTFLIEAQASGRKILLVVEDAENQDDEIMEQVRLLSNMEEKGDKLLSILLIGNKDLENRLSEHRHRALLQRVAVRCHAAPFTKKETAAYIRHRMMVAGTYLEVFTPEAVRAVHRFSKGNPKLINLACDHALMRGYLEKLWTIDRRVIEDYAKEIGKTFGLGGRGDKSSKLLPVALALAAVAVLALGAPLIQFEKKPQVAMQSTPPAPVSLYFEAGSARLSAQDLPSLDRVVEFMVKSPQSRVAIRGYTDSKGSAAQNNRVSAARAEAAKQYLVQQGIEPARIQALGMGPQKPAGAQATEDPKLSRRVELEVVANGGAIR